MSSDEVFFFLNVSLLSVVVLLVLFSIELMLLKIMLKGSFVSCDGLIL